MRNNNTTISEAKDQKNDGNQSSEDKILSQFFENSIVPQLLVDSELFLKNFTPAAAKLFSLEDEDINKSICGLREKFNHKAFLENIRGVFITERILHKEIENPDQPRYLMCIKPWFSEGDEVISGALITYLEMGIPFSLIKELEDLRIENQELKELLLRELRKSH